MNESLALENIRKIVHEILHFITKVNHTEDLWRGSTK